MMELVKAYQKAMDYISDIDKLNLKTIVIELAKTNPEEFLEILRTVGDAQMEYWSPEPVDIGKKDLKIIAAMALGEPSRKIAAIKHARAITGFSLKDSKDFVEKNYHLWETLVSHD